MAKSKFPRRADTRIVSPATWRDDTTRLKRAPHAKRANHVAYVQRLARRRGEKKS